MTTVRIKFRGHPILVSGQTDGNQFDIEEIDYQGDDLTDFILSIIDKETSGELHTAAAIGSVEDKADMMEMIAPIFKEFRK